MTAFDEIFVELALALLEEFGTPASFILRTAELDPDTDEVLATQLVETANTVPPSVFESHKMDGINIEDGEMITFVAPTSLTFIPIAKKTFVVFGGKTHTAVSVSPIYSGESIALYQLNFKL